MELKKRLDFRKCFVVLYVLFFALYIMVGLTPAEATNYDVVAELTIPSINLKSDVESLKLGEAGLETPQTIVGSFSRTQNKTLLIGHASTVFRNLNLINEGDVVEYDETNYTVVSIEVLPKAEIDMNKLLKRENRDTLVIMTCAGKMLGDGDATHRLLVTAERLE